MRRLTITYGDTILFDADNIDQFQWNETAGGVAVTAKVTTPAATKPGGGGLLDMLTSARRQQTEAIATEHKRALQAADSSDDIEGGADSE